MPALPKKELKELVKTSYGNREKVLRMMRGGEAHLGGAMSCMDILTVLYSKILNHDPQNPKWDKRDRFILSAGHKGVALYAVLGQQGYIDERLFENRFILKSRLPEHPDEKALPGIEFPTGSLGHGLSAGSGMAITAKLRKKDHRVFVLLGDGECEEGSVWEAVLSAAHHKLDNLIAIIDRNGLQVNGATSQVMDTSSLEKKFEAFGWRVKTIDGHDHDDIFSTLTGLPFEAKKPSCIIADTKKGQGISFCEGDFKNHHCHWEEEKIEKALETLRERVKKELLKIG